MLCAFYQYGVVFDGINPFTDCVSLRPTNVLRWVALSNPFTDCVSLRPTNTICFAMGRTKKWIFDGEAPFCWFFFRRYLLHTGGKNWE